MTALVHVHAIGRIMVGLALQIMLKLMQEMVIPLMKAVINTFLLQGEQVGITVTRAQLN